MNDRTYTTLDINENLRVRVEFDESPENPRKDWDCNLTGALSLFDRRNRIDVEPVHSWPRLEEAVSRYGVDEREYVRSWNLDQAWKVARWARIFHNKLVDLSDGTLWWVDEKAFAENWSEPDERGEYQYGDQRLTKWEIESEIIVAEQRTYNDWAEGNVYGVIVEQRVTRTVIDRDQAGEVVNEDEYDDVWDEVESCWGFYLDHKRPEDEQFIEYARDLVDLPETEAVQ